MGTVYLGEDGRLVDPDKATETAGANAQADLIKRRQLAKGGARLAEILDTIWP